MIYLLLFLANVFWALNVVVCKLNYVSFHPLFLVYLKILFSMIFMFIFILFKNLKFNKTNIKDLLINSNLINVINFIITFFALKSISGNKFALINCFSPLIIAFISRKVNLFLYSFFMFLGLFISLHFKFLDIGMLMLFIALIVYNFGNYRLKNLSDNIFIYNFYMFVVAFIELSIILLFIKEPLILEVNISYLLLFVFTSGFGYAFIQSVYYQAIKEIGILKTSYYMAFNPLFTYIFSIVFLDERIDIFIVIGFVIIFVSSLLFLKKRSK